MASTKQMQERAKARKAALKTKAPFARTTEVNLDFFKLVHEGPNATEDGKVQVYKLSFDESDDAVVKAFFEHYKALTGHIAMVVSESAEVLGARIHAQQLRMMFGDEEAEKAIKVMDCSAWDNCIAVVDTPDGKKVLPLRVGYEDVEAYRPAYEDTITLSAFEAAICRSALAWCALTNYAAQFGEGPKKALRTGFLSHTTQDEAYDFYWAAKYASSGAVHRVMD